MKPLKTYIVIILFISTCLNLQAQYNKIDSLKNKLSSYTQQDTSRIKIATQLIYEIYDVDPDYATTLIKNNEPLAKQLNYTKGMADLTYYKGHVSLIKGEGEKAIDYFNKSIITYKTLNHFKGIANAYNGIGIVYYDTSNFDKAIEFYKKSLSINKQTNNLHGIGRALNNIGNVYADQGSYKEAINYYLQSKKIKEQRNDDLGVASTDTNIGSIYGEHSNYPKALEYFHKALTIYKNKNNLNRSLALLSNIGYIYLTNDDFDNALTYYAQGLEISRKQGNKKSIARYLNDLGTVYLKQHYYEKALTYFKESHKIEEAINDKKGAALLLSDIANVQYILNRKNKALTNYKKSLAIHLEANYLLGTLEAYAGISKIKKENKEYKSALEHALKGQEIADKLTILKAQCDLYKLVSENYAALNNYEKAYETHLHYKTLNDSLFNKEGIKKLAKLEYEYKYKEELENAQEKEIQLTQKVKVTTTNLEKSQRNLLIGIITFLAIAILLGGIIFTLKLRNEKAKNQTILTEQKLLRTQMNPHFIFNALSVLQGMVLNKEIKKSVLYISKFSKLLRATLENSRDKMVTLQSELFIIENYLALQNIEATIPFNYTITIDHTIDTEDLLIPPMLIQPFIENAIEHGFETQKENKKISIDLKLENKQLICKIIDNGVGIDAKQPTINSSKKSLATTITKERLTILAKEFNTKASITIIDRKKYNEQGTLVVLYLPYQKNFA